MSIRPSAKFSLETVGWRSRIVVVFILMTIISLLSFGYFLTVYLMPDVVTPENLAFIIALSLVLSFIGFFILWKILRSLSRFKKYVEAVADGDLSQKLAVQDRPELTSIARPVQVIVERLQEDRLRLKNLSRELEKKVEERTFELGRTNEALQRELSDREKAENELHTSRRQLQALAARLESVRERERTRIAREIHDELGHMLTGLKLDLAWLGKKLEGAEDKQTRKKFADKIISSGKLLDQTIQIVRRIATQLRPEVLDHLGLVAAIEWEAQEFEKRTGVSFSMKVPKESEILSHDQATGLFRIFQEVLTNIARHAKASKAEVWLEEESGWIILAVKDNGIGIEEGQILNPQSLGLLGMKERTRLLGGELSISGEKGKGTKVTVKLPV
ncbi:ATP-binding protein [Verrucomicrobiota bacterium]